MKKVSLKDIATEAGVSTALVSYVLNNLKEGRIRKEVAQRIRDIAQSLNYRPNQIAKSLKMRKTLTLGLVVADISNPFSSMLARIVEDEAHKYKYTVIFGSSDEKLEKFGRLVDTFLNRQVDGLILSPPAGSEKILGELASQNVPFVLLDRYFPTLKTNYVVLDNHDAARKATKHLLQRGCRNIALITYKSQLVHLEQRLAGYAHALTESGLELRRDLIREVDISNEPGEISQSFSELLQLQQPADGILFASNMIAAQCLRVINKMALKIPDDLQVVCFDESQTLDVFHAPLTYVRQPLQDMGEIATRILLDQLTTTSNRVTQVQLEGQLIIRE